MSVLAAFHSYHCYATHSSEYRYTDHVARSATFNHGQALVELHQHTGEYDIRDNSIGDCVPAGVGVPIE